MPLSNIQIAVLRLLAVHRDPESYVGKSTPLNRAALRFSADVDVFHDRQERVIEAAGYRVGWIRQLPVIYSAGITKDDAATRLEWVVDSDFRFFPTIKDELFGYILHPVDLAANKLMAAAGRRERRDIVDLVTIHETILVFGGCGVGGGREVSWLQARGLSRGCYSAARAALDEAERLLKCRPRKPVCCSLRKVMLFSPIQLG